MEITLFSSSIFPLPEVAGSISLSLSPGSSNVPTFSFKRINLLTSHVFSESGDPIMIAHWLIATDHIDNQCSIRSPTKLSSARIRDRSIIFHVTFQSDQ